MQYVDMKSYPYPSDYILKIHETLHFNINWMLILIAKTWDEEGQLHYTVFATDKSIQETYNENFFFHRFGYHWQSRGERPVEVIFHEEADIQKYIYERSLTNVPSYFFKKYEYLKEDQRTYDLYKLGEEDGANGVERYCRNIDLKDLKYYIAGYEKTPFYKVRK